VLIAIAPNDVKWISASERITIRTRLSTIPAMATRRFLLTVIDLAFLLQPI
jgi:hypothetical protein